MKVSNDEVLTITSKRGSFKINNSFVLYNNNYSFNNAIFDTGCTNNLLSANLIFDKTKINFTKLKVDDIINPNVKLVMSFGIDGCSDETRQKMSIVNRHIGQINTIKDNFQDNFQVCKSNLQRYLNKDILNLITNTKEIRYVHNVKDYKIGVINIGSIPLRISYDLDNNNLIGMDMIERLDSRIFRHMGSNYLIITKLSKTSRQEIDIETEAITTIIDFYNEEFDDQVLNANYINKLLTNNDN